MAKKRAERAGPKAGAKPRGKGGGRTGRPVKAEGPKHNALSIRGATEGRNWLTRLSDHWNCEGQVFAQLLPLPHTARPAQP
jgi:hypothetical protein